MFSSLHELCVTDENKRIAELASPQASRLLHLEYLVMLFPMCELHFHFQYFRFELILVLSRTNFNLTDFQKHFYIKTIVLHFLSVAWH